MVLSAQDKRWIAEEDARTLMRAEEIRLDAGRKRAATTQIKKLVIEKEKEAKAAKAVASTLTTTKKRTSTRRKK